MASISFKTKIRPIDDSGVSRQMFNFKTTVGRTDCNLKPHEHRYYNSDLFLGMLNRAYQEAIGQKSWAFTDSLPCAVTVDSSGFLAVVTVQLPESFNR